jgi:hypothetical protein
MSAPARSVRSGSPCGNNAFILGFSDSAARHGSELCRAPGIIQIDWSELNH